MALPKILHDNRLDDGAPAASTTETGYNVANVNDWRPSTWWKPTAVPATITVDCASPKSADYGLIYGEAATYEIRGSTDNFSASDVLLGSKTLTARGYGLILFNSASYRYWRVRQTGTVGAVAIAAIGAALVLPGPLDAGFDPLGSKIYGSYNRSVAGQPLGRTIDFEEWSETIRVPFVTWSWLRTYWEPAWAAHLRGEPFGFAWDTDTYPDDVKLVVVRDGYRAPHQPGQLANLQMDLMGVK